MDEAAAGRRPLRSFARNPVLKPLELHIGRADGDAARMALPRLGGVGHRGAPPTAQHELLLIQGPGSLASTRRWRRMGDSRSVDLIEAVLERTSNTLAR